MEKNGGTSWSLSLGLRQILHILYPKRCPLCDKVLATSLWDLAYPVCDSCRSEAELVVEPVCKCCGKPLELERQEYCLDCTRHTHSFGQGKALWEYRGKVRESIVRFKYANRREYGISYAQLLAQRYGSWIRERKIEGIVPIPLHPRRRRRRGYNQAEILARELGRLTGLPVYPNLLVRSVDTRPQKELDDKERKKNLKRAFKIKENHVQLNYILLVDDIYTTGSTMDGAADVLKRAGVLQVYFLSVSIGRGY